MTGFVLDELLRSLSQQVSRNRPAYEQQTLLVVALALIYGFLIRACSVPLRVTKVLNIVTAVRPPQIAEGGFSLLGSGVP